MYQIAESTELNSRRLCISISKDEGRYCACELRMLENNSIPGFLTPHIRETGDTVVLSYDAGGRKSLAELCKEQKLSAEPVRSLVAGIGLVLSSIRGYFLNPNEVLYSPDYIYFGGSAFEFVYLPGLNKPVCESLAELATYLMDMIDYDDSEAVEPVYRLYGASKCESQDFPDIEKQLLREDEDRRDTDGEEAECAKPVPNEPKAKADTASDSAVNENSDCESKEEKKSSPSSESTMDRMKGRILKFVLLLVPRAMLLYLFYLSLSGNLMMDRNSGQVSPGKLLFVFVFVYALSGAYDFIILVIREKFLLWMKERLKRISAEMKSRFSKAALFAKSR